MAKQAPSLRTRHRAAPGHPALPLQPPAAHHGDGQGERQLCERSRPSA